MKVEYVPTLADALDVRRALFARQVRHPLVLVVFAGAACIAVGGTMMAATGSAVWTALPLAALVGATSLWAGFRRLAPRKASSDDAAPQSFDQLVYCIDVSDEGVRYDRGPFRACAAWSAIDRLVETDDHLILLERRGPGAMAYGLSKRELDRVGGTASWREMIRVQLKRRAGQVAA